MAIYEPGYGYLYDNGYTSWGGYLNSYASYIGGYYYSIPDQEVDPSSAAAFQFSSPYGTQKMSDIERQATMDDQMSAMGGTQVGQNGNLTVYDITVPGVNGGPPVQEQVTFDNRYAAAQTVHNDATGADEVVPGSIQYFNTRDDLNVALQANPGALKELEGDTGATINPDGSVGPQQPIIYAGAVNDGRGTSDVGVPTDAGTTYINGADVLAVTILHEAGHAAGATSESAANQYALGILRL